MLISTYVLCGIGGLSTIGMQLGALNGLAPSRKADFAKVLVRALIAGNAACFMTACIAGTCLALRDHLKWHTETGCFAYCV